MPARRAVLTLCVPFALAASASGAWMPADHVGATAGAIDQSPVIATADTLAAQIPAPPADRTEFRFEVIVAPASFEMHQPMPLVLPAFPANEPGEINSVPRFDDSLARLF